MRVRFLAAVVVLLAGLAWALRWQEPAAPVEVGPGPTPDVDTPLPAAPGGLAVQLTVRQLEEFHAPFGWPHRVLTASSGQQLVLLDALTESVVRVAPIQAAPAALGAMGQLALEFVDQSQRPIRGAWVWTGELSADGALAQSVSEADGRCTAAVRFGAGVPFVVGAPGYASEWSVREVLATDAAPVIRLQPAGALRVQVVGAPGAGGEVFVVPLDSVSSQLSVYPFLLGAVRGGIALDARGVATLADLPIGATVGVVVVHPHCPIPAPERVVIKAAGNELLVRLLPAVERHGRVLDSDGQPLAGARVIGGYDDDLPPSRRLLPPWLFARGAFVARSAASGQFSLGATAAHWRVAAPGFAQRMVAAQDEPVRLSRWMGVEPALVLDAPAEPWRVSCNLGGGLQLELTAGEPLRLSLPGAGRYEVTLLVRRAGEVTAQAGPLLLDVTDERHVAVPFH